MTATIADKYPDLERFVAELNRQEAAPTTVANFASDLILFAQWFEGTTGEAFAAATVTPTDLRDYRTHLQAVQGL